MSFFYKVPIEKNNFLSQKLFTNYQTIYTLLLENNIIFATISPGLELQKLLGGSIFSVQFF